MLLRQEQMSCLPQAARDGNRLRAAEISIDAIEEAVSGAFNICRTDLRGDRPHLRINDYPSSVRRARQAAVYLCRKLTGESPAQIGARLGFAASTVLGLSRRVEELVSNDPDFAARLAEALRHLQAICESQEAGVERR